MYHGQMDRQDGRGSLRWPVAGCVLAHAYVGQVMQACVGKAAGGASSGQWQAVSWHMPMWVR